MRDVRAADKGVVVGWVWACACVGVGGWWVGGWVGGIRRKGQARRWLPGVWGLGGCGWAAAE